MSKTIKPAPLTDEEFDRLGDFLERFPQAMNLETMDGFLAALICAPEMLPMGEVFPHVWGDGTEFGSYDEAQEITSLIMRHWNAIATTLDGDELYFPFLLEDEAGNASANDWAQGFYRGLTCSGGGWAELMNDEEQGGWIVPVLALAHERDPDPEMRPGNIDAEQRRKMISGLVVGLKKIYQYFAPLRRATARKAASIVRSTPKVGRNDPCPCGSGRKYKQCCAGKNPPLH